MSNKSESIAHQHCIQLFQAASPFVWLCVTEMVNLNLEEGQEISFESTAYFKKP